MSAGSMVYSCTSPSSFTLHDESSPRDRLILPLRLIVTVGDIRMLSAHVDDTSSVCACLTEPSVLVYILPGAMLSMCSFALVSESIATSGVVYSGGEHMVQLCVSGA